MKYLIIAFIKAWRAVVSPWYGPVCRYYPSCSAYGLEAVRLHGAAKGSWLIVRRLLRCNPWSRGGVDPVPGSALAATIAAELVAAGGVAATDVRTPESPDKPRASRPTNVAVWLHHRVDEVQPCC
jgi:putative membrane protein insertion efficiency factor